MADIFDETVRTAVLAHMNDDHRDDNLLIVRAFADASAQAASMSSFDGDGGEWQSARADGSVHAVRVPWPGGSITERREVRREIVALYDAACARLGVPPRPHE